MIRVVRRRMMLALFTGLLAVSTVCAQGGGGGTAQGGSVSNSTTATGVGSGATGVGSGTGSSGPFAGTVPSGFSGGTSGTSNTATKGTAGSATTVPSKSNTFAGTYANPYAVGLTTMATGGKTTSTAKAFGQPLYATTTTTGGTGGMGGGIGAATTNGFTSVGQIKAPRYSTALAEDVPLAAFSYAKIETTARDTIARSTYFKNRHAIQVAVRDDVVVLTGQVASDKERRNAENLLSLTPGIRKIDNRLTVVDAGQ